MAEHTVGKMDPLEKNIFLNTPEVTLPQQGSDVALLN